jgi:Na+/proline symporter
MDKSALKVGIIGGIISSLIVVIFIQPILSFIWRAFVAVAGSIHQGYVDRIYRQAALSDQFLMGQVAMLFLLIFSLFLTAVCGAYAIEKRNRLPFPSYSLTAVFAAIPFILMVPIIAVSVASGVMEINASFSQRLTVLAPAIDEHEYKTLRARWASMKGRNDYDALVSAMDARAKELNIVLPPARKP